MRTHSLYRVLFSEYVQGKYASVSRSLLVDAVNDKCANYRRKRRSVEEWSMDLTNGNWVCIYSISCYSHNELYMKTKKYSDKVVASLWQACNNFIQGCDLPATVSYPRYIQACDNLVTSLITSLWQPCHNHATTLSQSCHIVCTHPCYKMVTRLAFLYGKSY